MIFKSQYKKPVLIAGNGARTAGAVNMIHEFVKKTNIPLLTTMNGVDIAQDDLHIGFIGTHGNRVANMILNECDLIVAIGARLGIRQVGRSPKNFAPKADLIRVDIDEYELSRIVKDNEIKYHMDAKEFVEKLNQERVSNYATWKQKCMEAKEYLRQYDITEGNKVIFEISKLLPKNPMIAVDVGQNQCWSAQSFCLKGDYGRIHIGGGYGSMGCGLPFAIGTSIATNKGKTYCICGDGGLQMNIQELETIKREQLPIKIFVLNNKVLGKISETQHFNHGDRFANTAKSGGYTVPDFEKIATAYGIESCTLASYTEINKVKSLLENDNPCLINIMMSENSFLEPKIKFETGVISPKLSDEINQKVVEILT